MAEDVAPRDTADVIAALAAQDTAVRDFANRPNTFPETWVLSSTLGRWERAFKVPPEINSDTRLNPRDLAVSRLSIGMAYLPRDLVSMYPLTEEQSRLLLMRPDGTLRSVASVILACLSVWSTMLTPGDLTDEWFDTVGAPWPVDPFLAQLCPSSLNARSDIATTVLSNEYRWEYMIHLVMFRESLAKFPEDQASAMVGDAVNALDARSITLRFERAGQLEN